MRRKGNRGFGSQNAENNSCKEIQALCISNEGEIAFALIDGMQK